MSLDISDDPNQAVASSRNAEPPAKYWHSTAFALGTNCKSISILGCLFPCYQLMENRKRFHKKPSITPDICFTSMFCVFCCEYVTHKEIAESNSLPWTMVQAILLGLFCSPCLIWQDAHELKEREEGTVVPTFQGDLGSI
ncbi:putative PLAC8 family member [Monocercomonoides exilis]|uniref:putative PLAC8 family member n=1 Tax=Monocercomonoides exilis TaxID=2049356 RepID=UPI00355AC9FA|nr:putative PLAC8 family member [Monocercomonoides exilis]|eukprot:MONOS_1969.1-p1 / transcript=MONOS_1969.1 / gene=MONOS_1969 / organism=Monocercomonoides_exilis_PA203 / gene_product=PLAC8 family member / transcript_product=PLAC8 family member / location=Mono_scaffold00038:11261-11926(+) / protein_length=140 / sequence_SO=supercontig / SO=protein_coding / is_pseudo=false